MDCPVCGEKLKAIEKHGVEVDICPGCKGVWLDRGELEKILAADSGGPPPTGYRDERDRHDDDRHDDRDRDRDRTDDRGKKKRKSSLLGDILGGFGGD